MTGEKHYNYKQIMTNKIAKISDFTVLIPPCALL